MTSLAVRLPAGLRARVVRLVNAAKATYKKYSINDYLVSAVEAETKRREKREEAKGK